MYNESFFPQKMMLIIIIGYQETLESQCHFVFTHAEFLKILIIVALKEIPLCLSLGPI